MPTVLIRIHEARASRLRMLINYQFSYKYHCRRLDTRREAAVAWASEVIRFYVDDYYLTGTPVVDL